MGQYKYIINKRTGQQAIVPTNIVASLKSGVATHTSLPLTGNNFGDSRVANDTGHLYVWQKDSPTGLLTDWGDAGDFIDFTWDAISGKPSLTQLHDKNEDTKLDEGGVNETTVADVKVAVTQKHDTNKDQYLDYGGANQIAVTEVTKKLTSDKTYYINCDTGSNSNPGTSGSPFQTVSYALSLIPKNLNGYTVTIRLQNSLNYSEAIGTELNGFCGGRLEIRSDTSNPDNVLITLPIGSSKKEIILIEKTSAYILINRLSFRVNANNKRCISLGTNINSEIYGNKFGDNGNTGTTGVYLTSSEAKIQNCSDIDSNKVAVGIEVKAGSIAVITDSIFGDVNFPTGAGEAGSVYLVTNAADGKLFIHANTYNDVVNRVHTIDTDQYLDYGGGNQTQVTEIAKKMVTSKTVYVDGTNGDDSNPGTETLPYKTIGVALYNRPYMGVMNNSLTISIKAGTYDLTDVANVVYFGGAVGAGRLLIEAYLGQTVIIEGGANPPFSFNKVGHPVRIKGLSFRIKSDNVNCLGILDCTGRFQLSGVKFGDNWNTGTKGVIVDNSTVEIETCTDLDTNKVATGIEVVNGGIAIVVPESTSFGDTPYANSGGGVILKGASLCISQNDYESAIDLKHTQNTDTALDTDKLVVGEDGKITIATSGGYGVDFLTGGTASADSEYPEVGWLIPYAFNGSWVVPGWSSSVTDFPHWLKYDLGVGVSKIAGKIKIITLFEPNAYLKTVQIQGSNDDSSWTTIETIVLANNGNAQEFEFANENSYRYYRFYCVDSWSAAKNATIIEVELYEADALEDKLQVNGNAIIKGTISDGTNTSSLVGIKDAIDKKHLPGSDNQTAAEISTDETGETVQDELDELNQHVNSANDPHKEKRVLIFKVLEDDELLTTGDGKFRFVIPSTMAGMNLIEAHVHIYTESSSGLPEIQIQNQTQAQNMLSVPITIDAGEYDSKNATTLPTIDTSNDDVDDGDIISVDCDGEGTGALGLEVRLTFQKP